MKDFACSDPADMHYKKLADRAKYFKEDEKGVEIMCRIMEELIDDEKKEIALRMIRSGRLSNEEIAEFLQLDVGIVNTLNEEQQEAADY